MTSRRLPPRVIAVATVALAMLARPAMAQQAERPDVRVGDRWRFVVYWGTPSREPNRTWTITSIGPEGIEGTEDGEPLRLTRDLNVVDSPRQRESNPKALSFPMAVGKQWRYTSNWLFKPKSSRGTSVVDVTVVGHEKITVVAGEFDAFRLVSRAVMRGISGINSQIDAETSATYWYAPAARAIVKSVTRNPYLGTSTVELADVQLKP